MMKICGNPIETYRIVLPAEAEAAVKTAADFLRRVIGTACGVTLPLAQSYSGPSIRIGTRGASDSVKWDGYRIMTDARDLYLDGNIARGTLYAAYSFAERFLGYRYFAPGCEKIPAAGQVDIQPGFDIADNPVFEGRRHDWGGPSKDGEYASHMRLNDCTPTEGAYGGTIGPTGDCHTFARLCPPELYFDRHPEYYSLWEGKRIPVGNVYGRDAQLCLTNPDVLRIVTENVLKELRENPDRRIVELSQCDNRRCCQCPDCAAVDEEEGSHAGTLIRFVNAVAEEVEKEFPDTLVRTFAYQYTRKAPKHTKARRNVLVRYCTIEACFRHPLTDKNCERNTEEGFAQELEDWQKMADQMSIWDYVTNYNSYIAPFPNLLSLRENARLFADCHAIHLFEEDAPHMAGGAYPELRAYLIGKLLWDPTMSEETYQGHIDEFLEGYFGPGWREIRRYIDLEHELTAHRCIRCFETVDIAPMVEVPENAVIQEYVRSEYTPHAYQPVYPGETYMTKLEERMDEVQAMWSRAYEAARTEEQRERIARGRMAVNYLALFCMPHEKGKMSEAERAAYEAAAERFNADKIRYGFHYNIWTGNVQQR